MWCFTHRCDVTRGRLCASLRVTLKGECFAAISYTTRTLYGNWPQMRNDITSDLEVGQRVATESNSKLPNLIIHHYNPLPNNIAKSIHTKDSLREQRFSLTWHKSSVILISIDSNNYDFFPPIKVMIFKFTWAKF